MQSRISLFIGFPITIVDKLYLYNYFFLDDNVYQIYGNVNKYILKESIKKFCIKFEVISQFSSDIIISTKNEKFPVKLVQPHVTVQMETAGGKKK